MLGDSTELKAQGKNPFILDSTKEPKGDFRAFIMNEVRYASLKKASQKQQKLCTLRQKQMLKTDLLVHQEAAE